MIIAFAVPVFFSLIGVELLVAKLQGRADYLRFNDAIAALGCGIGSQVTGIFAKVVLLAIYWGVYQLSSGVHLSLDPFHWAWWVFAFIALDHQYYWWHRASHRVNLLWGAHIVHHHSQEYNLAVALRQAWFTGLSGVWFYLPLALLGVHPVVYALCGAMNTLYQFWIHTRTVGRLGPLEWVMNTPSHHRVHHGINPEYIDRNYAGVFIVWDRMYGTFVREEEEPVYGTVTVYDTFDPIWANFHYPLELVVRSWRYRGLRNKVWVWFAPPEWTPEGDKQVPQVSADTYVKWDVPPRVGVNYYVANQFVVVTAAAVAVLVLAATGGSWVVLAIATLGVLWGVWSFSRLLEWRRFSVPIEVLRVLALPPLAGLLAYNFGATAAVTLGALVFGVASLVWLIVVTVKNSAATSVSAK